MLLCFWWGQPEFCFVLFSVQISFDNVAFLSEYQCLSFALVTHFLHETRGCIKSSIPAANPCFPVPLNSNIHKPHSSQKMTGVEWLVDGTRAIFNKSDKGEEEDLWQGTIEEKTFRGKMNWYFVFSKEDAKLRGARGASWEMEIDLDALDSYDIRPLKEVRKLGGTVRLLLQAVRKKTSRKVPITTTPNSIHSLIRSRSHALGTQEDDRKRQIATISPVPPGDSGRGKRQRKQTQRSGDFVDLSDIGGSDEEMEDYEEDYEEEEGHRLRPSPWG